MDFSKAMQMASPMLLGLGSDLAGRTDNAMALGILQMQQDKERSDRKAALATQLGEMGLGPKQTAMLDAMPLEMQERYVFNKMAADDAHSRALAKAGAADARRLAAAREQNALMAQYMAPAAPQTAAEPQLYTDGSSTVPASFAPLTPQPAAPAPSQSPISRDALLRAMADPNLAPETVKRMEAIYNLSQPEAPQIIEGADGYKYQVYADGRPPERLLPDVVQEEVPADEYGRYVQETIEAGETPLDRISFAQAKKGKGFSMRTLPDGTQTVSFGGPQGEEGMDLTEVQAKDNVFATRAEGALKLLDDVGAEVLTSFGNRAADRDPTGLARNFQSEDFQVARQAGDEFLQAILRKDTGAAITEPEQVLYGRTYLPQVGDGPRVIEAKRQSRIRAIEALKSGMHPVQVVMTERALINAAKRAEEGEKYQPLPDVPTEFVERAGSGQILTFNPETGLLE